MHPIIFNEIMECMVNQAKGKNMCFRPAEADVAAGIKPTQCRNCGKTVFPTEGLLPKKCPFCREELLPAIAAPSVPSVPGAPKAPVAPAAPKAPGAPAAPKTDE